MPVVRFKQSTAVFLAALIFLFSFLPGILITAGIMQSIVDLDTHVTPSYEKEDLSPVLKKDNWTDSDYEFLRKQTGLYQGALDAFRDRPERITEFQEALFYEGEIVHTDTASLTPHCMMKDFTAPIAPLENGDILITSSCHTLGWKNGHAAIVIDAQNDIVLEATRPGSKSRFGSVNWFRQAANFLVLRLKGASKEERNEIAQWAEEHLYGVDYSLFVGFFYPKDQGDSPAVTHCSHLVWQAYYHFGYDLDADRGRLAACNDIARSPLLEKVQVYGFNVDRGW